MGTELNFDPGPIESRHHGSTVQVVVESFGYLHNPAPEAHLTIDLRQALYNPHHDPAMRELTGLHPLVRDHVLATADAQEILAAAARLVATLLPGHDRRAKLVRVAFGCAGGRHRSVVLANELTNLLLTAGIGAEVTHRDVLRPVVRRVEGGA
jgi:UPF0042 nucleotide-binding protein